MTEERTKMKRYVENGKYKWSRVPFSVEDELEEKQEEVTRLKALVDSLRVRVEQLEEEQKRQQLRDMPVDEASSYRIYR